MARSPATRPAAKTPEPAPKAKPDAKPAAPPQKEGHRETVEAVAVAFILALLVRGFEAEAFMIPTGSMAPTLMGRHKEVNCPQCGYLYAVNAADEVEGYSVGSAASRRVDTGICVNCRYQCKLADTPSFKGDRILVLKFPYDLPRLPGSAPPSRWDVVVFRYPEEPETSYIKRLVGLAGETLRIWYGDVFIKPPGGSDFALQRKPLVHQRAMQMTVHDDAHRPSALKDRPEWRRWVPATPGAWTEEVEGLGVYLPDPAAKAKPGDWPELRYRHVLPDPGQWRAIEEGDPVPRSPRTTLITDFYSYNTNLNADHSDLTGPITRDQESAWLQPHWVGDRTVSARVAPAAKAAAGAVRFDLIEGGVLNRCEIDPAGGGTATLSHGGVKLGEAVIGLKAGAAFAVEFANVDNRLTLWVDGRPVFGDGLSYDDPAGTHPAPTVEDLAPVRLSARGGGVRLSDLVLKRDIYYTLNPGQIDYGRPWDPGVPQSPSALFDLLAEPAKVAAFGPLGTSDYAIGPDRFLMLGDNSPRSKDSRGWETRDRYEPELDQGWDRSNRERWEVPRSMLTGKAFCIYWPHGKPFGPDVRLGPDFRLPFRPYFERMKLIH